MLVSCTLFITKFNHTVMEWLYYFIFASVGLPWYVKH